MRRDICGRIMALDVVVTGNAALVICRGQLVHGASAHGFQACVRRLLRRHGRVALDLRAVTRIDARGVGTLASLLARANAANRRLVLEESSARVQRVLHISRLDVQFQDAVVVSSETRTLMEDLRAHRGRPERTHRLGLSAGVRGVDELRDRCPP